MAEAGSEQTQRTRPWWRVCWRGALGLVLVVALVFGAFWARLAWAPLSVPPHLATQIEARIDAAMVQNDLDIGEMVLALPEGGLSPALEFRDVALRGPDGGTRALLPVLRVRVSPGPILRGQMRVRSVEVEGAGINLSRDLDGRVDLDFAGGTDPSAPAAEAGLSATLAKLDTMFDNAVFTDLERVTGQGLEVTLTDAKTGQTMRLHGATLDLIPGVAGVALSVGGDLVGSRAARLDLRLGRDLDAGTTELAMEFQNLAARDLAAATPALAWLDLMRAPMDGALNAVLADDGTIGAVDGWLDLGAGQITLAGLADPLAFEHIAAQVAYDPDTSRARFDAVRVTAPDMSFQAAGHADISASGDVYTGQFQFQDIRANPGDLFQAPVSIAGADVDLRLRLGDEVTLEIGQAALYEADLRATLSGRVDMRETGVAVALDAHLDRADVATILGYWPLDAIPNTRWWVEEHLSQGMARGADFSLRLGPGADPRSELSFDFAGARIQALPDAPPIEAAAGVLSLIGNRLSVAVDAGEVAASGQAPVSIAGSHMVIEDVSQRGPDALFDLAITGPVSGLMHVLAGPPLAVLAQSDLGPDEVGDGQITARAQLVAPLTPRGEAVPGAGLNVAVNAQAQITDYSAAGLVPDRVLAAERLDLVLTPERLTIGGAALLDDVPLDAEWSVAVGPDAPPGSRVEARASLNSASLARFGVTLPDWLFSGAAEAELSVDLARDQPAILRVATDLDGAAMAIPALAWRLSQAQTATLAADIRLGPQPEVTSLVIEGAGLSVAGRITFTEDGGMDRFSASRFRLGDWLDVQGALIANRGAPPQINIAGGRVDFRTMPSLAGGTGASGDVGALNIALDTMQITSGIALTDLQAQLNGAEMSGTFRGRVNADAPVNGRLIPSANGPTVQITARNGGRVMRAAGIVENLYGGAFELVLAPRPAPGRYRGRLSIDGPRLRDAPVMAELLNVISVVGLLEQLSGDGINMGQVDAQFRITPDSIFLDEGAAVGPSMGISMDGTYDVATQRYEMQGVISPLYLVNGLAGALFAPRREGLFGFNYRLSGAGDQTQVNVNPLSILTPGIFREIFRAPAPDFSDGGGGG